MVDTVLSRDKNWVRWKAESCPAIEKAAVSAKEWDEAKDGVRKASAVRPMRDVPLGSLDLGFLSDTDPAGALQKLKSSDRWVSSPSAFEAGPEANAEDADTEVPKSNRSRKRSPKRTTGSCIRRTTQRRRPPQKSGPAGYGGSFVWVPRIDWPGSTNSERTSRACNHYTEMIVSMPASWRKMATKRTRAQDPTASGTRWALQTRPRSV